MLAADGKRKRRSLGTPCDRGGVGRGGGGSSKHRPDSSKALVKLSVSSRDFTVRPLVGSLPWQQTNTG